MSYTEYAELLAQAPDEISPAIEYDGASFDDDPSINSFLTESLQQERERIEAELTHIDEQLQDRAGIHEQAVKEIEQALRDEKDRLDQLARQAVSRERVLDQKRRLQDRRRELRNERTSYWKDCQRLLEDRRELLRDRAEVNDTDLIPSLEGF